MFADDVKTGLSDDDDDDDDDWDAEESWLPEDFVSKYAFRSFAPCAKVSCDKPKDLASIFFEDSPTQEEGYAPRKGSRTVLYDQPISPLVQVKSPDAMKYDTKDGGNGRSSTEEEDDLKADSKAPSSPTSRKRLRFKLFRRKKTVCTATESKVSNSTGTKGQKTVYKSLEDKKEEKRSRFKLFGRKGKVTRDTDSSNDENVEKIQTDVKTKTSAEKATKSRAKSKSVYNCEELDATGDTTARETAGGGDNDSPVTTKRHFFKRGLFNRRAKKQPDDVAGEKASKASLYVRQREEKLQQKEDESKYQKIDEEEPKTNQKRRAKKGRHVYAKLAFPPQPVIVVPASPMPKAIKVEAMEADPLSPTSTEASMAEETSPRQAGIIETSTSSESETSRMLRMEKALSRQMMEDLLLLANLEKERRSLERRGVQDEDMRNNLGEKASDAVARVESVIEKSRRNRSMRRQATQPKKTCYEEATSAFRAVLGCPAVPYKRVD
jgi:hypothetical protein